MTTKKCLTAKQEAFALNYFTTRNATQSVIKAGYSPHLASTHTTNILRNAKVQARLQQLQAEIVPDPEIVKAVIREKLEILTEIARHGIEMPVSAGHKITAIAEMNKMEGHYAPEKHAIIGDITIRIIEDAD